MFAINLVINVKLGQQLFESVIINLISNTKCATGEGEAHLEISESRLRQILNAADGRDNNEDGEF